jgi:hypothetical protein
MDAAPHPPARCEDGCECTPTASGYYWATHRKYGWRRVVLIELNGHRHLRAFAHRMSGSFGLEEFKDYRGPLTENQE